MAVASTAASECISLVFKAMGKPKLKELAGQFESDKVVEDESVNKSLSISQTKAQKNPPRPQKCSTSGDILLFPAMSTTWFTSISHSLWCIESHHRYTNVCFKIIVLTCLSIFSIY